jgi:ribulose-phosphate 3-epimerase
MPPLSRLPVGAMVTAQRTEHRTMQRIKSLGKRVGVVINPDTPAAVLEEILQDVNQVLEMTVNLDPGHQSFIHTTLPKNWRVRQMLEQINPGCDLAANGGVDATTAPLAVDAGANVLVARSSISGNSEGGGRSHESVARRHPPSSTRNSVLLKQLNERKS